MLSIRRLLAAGVVLRVAMLAYGAWMDSREGGAVKYTDIDYLVVADAARLFRNESRSPYDRPTFRYPPVLAWLAAYVPAPRAFYAATDVLAAAVLLRLDAAPEAVAAVWLLNPFVANISTRGSSDCLSVLPVLLALLALRRAGTKTANPALGYSALAGALLAVAVHLRIYPVIFLLPFVRELSKNSKWVTKQQCFMLFAFVGIFLALFAASAAMHGWRPVLENAYLYHLTRVDHRHNFSVYSYAMLLFQQESLYAMQTRLLLRVVPLLVTAAAMTAIALAPRFKGSPAAAMFFMCFFFVANNKVATSQYAVWFLSLLPLALLSMPQLGLWRLLVLALLWFSAQGIWLYFAFQLEFRAINTYRSLFVASAIYFAAQMYIFNSLLGYFVPLAIENKISSVSHAQTSRKGSPGKKME